MAYAGSRSKNLKVETELTSTFSQTTSPWNWQDDEEAKGLKREAVAAKSQTMFLPLFLLQFSLSKILEGCSVA